MGQIQNAISGAFTTAVGAAKMGRYLVRQEQLADLAATVETSELNTELESDPTFAEHYKGLEGTGEFEKFEGPKSKLSEAEVVAAKRKIARKMAETSTADEIFEKKYQRRRLQEQKEFIKNNPGGTKASRAKILGGKK